MSRTVVFVSLVLVAVLGATRAKPTVNCVPDQKGFYYKAPCPSFNRKPKISISKITGAQGGVSVDGRGGLDLTIPLTLTFNVSYNGRPLRTHRIDMKLYKYVQDDSGHCHWKELETAGVSDDLDACKMIKNVDCTYRTKPTYVVSVVDWQELWGDAVGGLDVGAYYAFESTERDGNDILNCFWIQSKIAKAS